MNHPTGLLSFGWSWLSGVRQGIGLSLAALSMAVALNAAEPTVRPARNVSTDDPLWPALQKRMTEAGAGVTVAFRGWREIDSPALKKFFPDYRFFESIASIGDIAGFSMGRVGNVAGGVGFIWVFTKEGETVSTAFDHVDHGYPGGGFGDILAHLLAARKIQVLNEADAQLMSDALFSDGDSSSSLNRHVVKSGERRWQLASFLGFRNSEDDEWKFITEVVLDDDHRVVAIEGREEKTGRKVSRPIPPPRSVAVQQTVPLFPTWVPVALGILVAGASILIFRRRSLSRKSPDA